MKLQTTIPILAGSNLIDYDSKVVLLGSCFSENVGDLLSYFKFQTVVNPFGIIFNPVSIENLIQRALEEKEFTEADIFFHNELWHCFEVHSNCSHPEKESLVINLNERLTSLRKSLLEATHLIITLGTSWVYRNLETNTLVANCHKVAQKEFSKELLSLEQVASCVYSIAKSLTNKNDHLQIVGTVSPVRHLKDGFIKNNRSKSHLLAGLHSEISRADHLHYFPSYEIMMDELRDYRFYKEDMIHPNKTAISIIWDKFKTAWIDPSTGSLQKRISEIQAGLSHKPFHSNSSEHALFLQRLQEKINIVEKEHPHIKF